MAFGRKVDSDQEDQNNDAESEEGVKEEHNGESSSVVLSQALFFAHAPGDAIRVWSLSRLQQDVYIMKKELKVHVPTEFERKEDELLPLMTSCWKFGQLLSHSVESIEQLGLCHNKEQKRAMRHEESDHTQHLDTLVNPRILKITEKKHKMFIGADGPHSSSLG
ncbi:hypothetical protein O0I10_008182 [Lichtheimia ornata]|uniref:Uncharacterized protein n=1 Tax=Lichtheimia ornata TaxID=688661 RepID=A0AAD7UYW7_9FUNG|nr:uncharacterized protein O0I10_008182 [Lichtheimia ornata]KAJ8656169.1 hypothetical protein O0I10_008182 [Lichtheimia ornata]